MTIQAEHDETFTLESCRGRCDQPDPMTHMRSRCAQPGWGSGGPPELRVEQAARLLDWARGRCDQKRRARSQAGAQAGRLSYAYGRRLACSIGRADVVTIPTR